MTEEEMAEEYEENAECVEVNDYGQKVYGSIEIEEAFLAGLKAGKPKWHKANEIQCYEDIPNNKDKLYVWVVNIAKFEKDKPILETRVGSCDELEYDIMAYHLIKWCEIPEE